MSEEEGLSGWDYKPNEQKANITSMKKPKSF